MKRIFKKTIATMLCVIMMLGIAPLNGFVGLKFPELHLPDFGLIFETKAKADDATSGTCGDNLTWEYDDSTNTLTISGSGNMKDYSSSNPPPWYSFSLNTVIVENGVKSFGDCAFWCCNIKNMIIPTTLSWWSSNVFSGSTLENVTYNAYDCSLAGSNGNHFFSNSSLIRIEFGPSVSTIPRDFLYNCNNLTTITIPDNVMKIGARAFQNCSGITNLTIGGNVNTIDYMAFDGCTSLTSVTIPDSVTSIGADAFRGCNGLTSITVDSGNTVYHSEGNCLIETESKTLITGCKNSIIPDDDSVTNIGVNAFYGCTGLTSVTIPDSVTSIGKNAFSGCKGISEILVPNSVTEIGENAFSGCSNLVNINIPSGVTEINDGTFASCTSLTSITIPDGVITIGEGAFNHCDGLTDIDIPDSVKYLGGQSFAYCQNLESVSCKGVAIMGGYVFYNCRRLNNVTLGNSLDIVYDRTFYGCWPKIINYTGTIADWYSIYFTQLDNLSYFTYAQLYIDGNEITELCAEDFEGITGINANLGCFKGIKRVFIPDSVLSIADNAFSKKTQVILGPYNGNPGESCWGASEAYSNDYYENGIYFSSADKTKIVYCDSSTETIIIPETVTSIGDYAFYNCNSLKDIYYLGNRAQWSRITIGDEDSVIENAVDYFAYDGSNEHAWIHFTRPTTISFDTQGGTEVDSIIGMFGETITTTPATPAKEGYSFAGWDSQIPTTFPDEDVTITALWTVNQYTLSFDTDGGTEIEPVTLDYGTPLWSEDKLLDSSIYPYLLSTGVSYGIGTFKYPGATNLKIKFSSDSKLEAQRDWLTIYDGSGNQLYKGTGSFANYEFSIPGDCFRLEYYQRYNYSESHFSFESIYAEGQITKPSKYGHTFAGWAPEIPETMPANDLTLTALWNPNMHQVSFDCNGGEELEPIMLAFGTNVAESLPAPVREGYTFLRWSGFPATMPDEDISVTAVWRINSYTITFDTDGGTPETEPIIAEFSSTLEYNQPDSTLVLDSSTYPQSSHNYANNSNVTYSFDYPGASSLKLKFSSSCQFQNGYDYLYIYDGSGALIGQYTGTTLRNQEITVPGDSFSLLLTSNASTTYYGFSFTSITAYIPGKNKVNEPHKTGYTFIGWDKEFPATMPAEDVTITALWSINEHTITFDSNGGSDVEPITQNYGTEIVKPADPTRTGFTFAGWDTAIPETMPDEDLTLTAQWTRNTYKITYLDDDGSVLGELEYDYDSEIYTTWDAYKTGYTFTGWDAEIPEKMPAENLTFTASWSINSYTLTFVFGNGQENLEITQNYNTQITAPDNPARTGYTFTGWNETVPELMPAYDMTITAQWQVNSYTITYYDQPGESVLGTRTYYYGSSVSAPGTYYKSGYMLKGWVWPEGKDAKPDTMPAYNIKAYAIWVVDDGAHSGHDIRIINSAAPTCTEDGFSGRSFCNTCGKGIDNGYTLPAYGHDYVRTVARNETCTEDGIRTCICNYCGDRSEEAIPATGHSRTNEEITTQPTCTGTGVRTITCHCGYSWTETVPANGHNYDDITDYVPASCGQEGYVIKKCTECDSTVRETIKALEHNYVTDEAVEPTCTQAGRTLKKYCKLCGKVETDSTAVPALGHDYQDYVLSEANCTDAGRYIKICSRCNCVEPDSNGENVQTTTNVVVPSSQYPESPHNYSNYMNKTYSFSYSGATELILKFSSSTRFESGYDYLYIYDSDGSQLGKYSGTQLSGTTIRVPGSSFTLKLTSDGSSTYYGFKFDSITALSYNYDNAKVYTQAALGHDYEEITIKESTCQETGKYVKKCKRCGEYVKDDTPVYESVVADSSMYPETPHSYENSQEYNYDFTYPNAKTMTVKFSSSCKFEDGYDFLYIYDAGGNKIGEYTGTALQGKEITINGDSFSIKVTTDRTTNYYGFSIDSITCQTDTSVKKFDRPKSDHDYEEVIAKPATPLETGILTCICKVCGHGENRVIPKTLYAVGEVISYGSYPQSKVIDKNLLNQLNAQPATWHSFNYYAGDGYTNNGRMGPSDYMKYADVSYGGEKYRAVTFTLYRPAASGGIPAVLGDYSLQDNYGYYKSNVYWFKYEPIQWRILDPTLGLVVSEKSIDAQAFSNFVLNYYGDSSRSYYANNWAHSSIRSWLNNDFYNTAFTSSQRANILTTDLENMNYTTMRGDSKSSIYDCDDTSDKVFLLSYDEILNLDYGFSGSPSASDERVAYGTDYARCQGLGEKAEEISAWYLRTSANRGDRALLVAPDGSVETDGAGEECFVGATIWGIRPALRLSNISATGGASSSGQVYNVTYQIGGNTLGTLQISQGSPIVRLYAAAPEGYAFSGWDEPEQMPGEDITLTGEYLPLYKATFKADGEKVGEVEYTTASTAIIEPEVPAKEGYIGRWEEYSFTAGGITVNAVYEKEGEHVHSYTEYTSKQPTCTEKGEKTFICSCGDSYTTSITPLGHSFTNYVYNNDATTEKDGTETAKCDRCTETDTRTAVGTKIIPGMFILTYDANGGTDAPARQNGNGSITLSSTKPTRSGYKFLGWAESADSASAKYQPGAAYSLKKNSTLYAVWQEENTDTYSVTFIADGKIVDTVKFKFGDTSISEPAVPAKEGYTGKWSAYTLAASNITVQAVYTKNETPEPTAPTYKLPKFGEKKAAYNTIVTVSVTLTDIPSGAEVKIDGKPAQVSGKTYSADIGQVSSTKDVKIEVIKGGKALDSSSLKINVDSSFFGKLGSFFSNFLFNMFKWKTVTVNF